MRHKLADVGTWTTPTQRIIACPVCGQQFRVHRRGVPGGALASTAKLRGTLNAHMTERHAEEIRANER